MTGVTVNTSITGNNTGASNATVTLASAKKNDYLLAFISITSVNSALNSVSTLNGGTLTWSKLGSNSSLSSGTIAGNIEVWAATRPSANITNEVVTVNTTAVADAIGLEVIAYSGVDIISPIETAIAAANATTTGIPTKTGIVCSATGAIVVVANGTGAAMAAVPTGYTDTGTVHVNNSNSATFRTGFFIPGSASTYTAAYGASYAPAWQMEALVLRMQLAPSSTITTNLTKLSQSASAGAYNLAILAGSTAVGASGTGASSTLTYTNSAPCVMVLKFTTWGAGGFVGISGVTDSAGVTWTRRNSTQYHSIYTGAASTNYITQEVWWANVTAIHGSAVTVTVAKTNTGVEGLAPKYNIFGVTGSQVPATPWDTAGATTGTYSNASGTATTVTTAYAANSSHAMILAFMDQSGNSVSTVGGGDTLIGASSTGSGASQFQTGVEYLIGTGSGSMAWTGNALSWVNVTDALTSSATGTAAAAGSVTGTVTMSLTKASLSASVTVTNGMSGTIATHLTKLSQAVTTKETFTGTVATRLTKVSQSFTGVTEKFVGSVTSGLTKISQSASATVKYTGTITTTLRGVNQAASGVEYPMGSITTHLSGISQTLHAPANLSGSIAMALRSISQAAAAKEIVTGTAVTNIETQATMSIVANTYELFVGHITTRLGPANFSLVSEEDFIGTVSTKLGTLSGQTVANVVQAEVIILGPIEMNLGPLNYTILGAKLGTPGNGKWYSYRYLDS